MFTNLLRLSPALGALVFFSFFVFSASFGDQYRYLTPISVFIAWSILQIPCEVENLKTRQAQLLVVVTLICLIGSALLQFMMAQRISASISGQIELQLARAEMGRWLEKNTQSGTRVLSGDLGAVAYFNPSNFYVDSVGLTNSGLVSDLVEGRSSYGTHIKSSNPDILVDTVDQNGVIGSEWTYNNPDKYYDQNVISTPPESLFRNDYVLNQIKLLPERSSSELLVGAYTLTKTDRPFTE